MFAEPEDHEDDVEVFKDAPESDMEKDNEEGAAAATSSTKPAGHDSYKYDGRKREPQFANASNSCLWEIAPLLSHYHPSVALHASQLLYGQTITTKADLELHTLSHFLDRFVYRNAKKALPASAASIMKPGGKGLDRSGMVLMRKGASAPTISAEGPLNNEKFAKSKEEEIPVDQVFFHRYFSQKLAEEEHVREKQNKNKRKRKAGDDDDSDDADSEDDISIGDDAAEAADLLPDDSDIENAPEDDEVADEDDDSELDEDEVWKAMKASMPPAKGDADLMEDSGSNEDGDDDDDDSVAEFAYSDSEDGKDAAMDAILEKNSTKKTVRTPSSARTICLHSSQMMMMWTMHLLSMKMKTTSLAVMKILNLVMVLNYLNLQQAHARMLRIRRGNLSTCLRSLVRTTGRISLIEIASNLLHACFRSAVVYINAVCAEIQILMSMLHIHLEMVDFKA
jgi:hypothetical protein